MVLSTTRSDSLSYNGASSYLLAISCSDHNHIDNRFYRLVEEINKGEIKGGYGKQSY